MKPVFISYAHIDNKPLTEGQKGWVARLHEALEVLVSQAMGEDTKIWFDPTLTGADDFSATIVRGLEEARILVSIVTPRYVKSDWCVREARTFSDGAAKTGGVRLNNKFRLIKTVKTPLDKDAAVPTLLDELFQAQLGFEFYRWEGETLREFNPELGEEYRVQFHLKASDLAREIGRLLKSFPTASGGQDTAPGGAQASGSSTAKTIYLATTTSDSAPARDQIRRELEDRGHIVLPESPLPLVADELEKVVRDYLARADVAVHLIGRPYGAIPEGSQCSMVELQNRLAAERSANSSLSRFIWLPKNLETDDERQKGFIRALREEAAAQRGAEIVQDVIEKLKDLILEKLKPVPATAVSPPTPGGPPQVYLVCDQRDEQAADPVEDFLAGQRLEVTRPHFDGTEAEFSEAHRRHLQDCDGVLIYYGATSRSWVDVKSSDLKQIFGYGRAKPFRAQAVCLAPPDDRNKQRFRTQDLEIIRFSEQFSPDLLAPFVRRLTAQPAGPA